MAISFGPFEAQLQIGGLAVDLVGVFRLHPSRRPSRPARAICAGVSGMAEAACAALSPPGGSPGPAGSDNGAAAIESRGHVGEADAADLLALER